MAGETPETPSAEATPAPEAEAASIAAEPNTENKKDAAAEASAAPDTQSQAGEKPAQDAAKADDDDLGPSLLDEDEPGETPEKKADGQADAEKGDEGGEYQSFKLPEGFDTLDEATLGKAVPLFKKHKLNQDDAQELVTFHAEEIKRHETTLLAGQRAGHKQMVDEWKTAAKADPEFGGEKFTENKAVIKAALNQFTTPEFRQMAKEWGFDNNPDFLRAFYRIGKAISPDQSVTGETARKAPKTLADALYTKEE